jgi:hypothetical protein
VEDIAVCFCLYLILACLDPTGNFSEYSCNQVVFGEEGSVCSYKLKIL